MKNNIEEYINTINCMDNLEFMKQLPSNLIDLIYCDIFYNTGRKYKDYNDKLGTPLDAIEWYKPRLIEMYRILKDTGSIYLQCDYRLVHYLKVRMDYIFGFENFRNEIIWNYDRWTNSGNDFIRCHDDILRYSKTNTYIYNTQFEEFSIKSKHKGSRFSKINNNGKLEQEYTNNKRKKAMKDVWNISILNSQAKERVGYDTQKPETLIERIIKSSSNEGDIVLDMFCGSGTTGVVAKKLNRKYILCDNNPKACEISQERINKINN
jgi:site-specific DNA-methyltransferase (adenine-specific)